MRELFKPLAILAPLIALAAGVFASTSGSASQPQSRALSLKVDEQGDRVEIQLIAQSQVTQQVQYEVELIGNSRAHHSGDTQIAAGDRQVLSRLVSNGSNSWCAKVEVREASGANYTLTAGDCT